MESGYGKIMTAVDSLYMGKRDSVSAAIYQLPDLEILGRCRPLVE